MGEMIKFGIKLALTIACAGALVAALLLLFNALPSFVANSTVGEMFSLIGLIIPINIYSLFVIFSTLFSFKVAYWAADKMIQFISAMG